jgi:AraC family transcriptional regulator of adaptative response/methylated-DNA-[protein]-cysteine methyltransferase
MLNPRHAPSSGSEPDLFARAPAHRARSIPHEAMTVDSRQRRGEGLVMRYGFHPSPFGDAILVTTEGGLAGLGFADGDRTAAFADMQRRWPQAQYQEDADGNAALARYIFDPTAWRPEAPLKLTLIGTDFELRVWRMLLDIPLGAVTAYSDLARQLGRPSAARAVGAAVGKNPISFVVPCHRVLGRSGALTGYHWGLPRKRAMLAWEADEGIGP